IPPPQASIDTNPADAHTGNASLKLVATAAWQGTWQRVPVSAGQSYSFTAWGRSNVEGGQFTLISQDSNGNEVQPRADFTFAGVGSWVPVAATYSAPVGAVRVAIIPQSATAGTFLFDDLALSPANNLVANPGFEVGSTAWIP